MTRAARHRKLRHPLVQLVQEYMDATGRLPHAATIFDLCAWNWDQAHPKAPPMPRSKRFILGSHCFTHE